MIKKVLICCLFMCCSTTKKHFDTDTKNEIIHFISSIDKSLGKHSVTIENVIATEIWSKNKKLYELFCSGYFEIIGNFIGKAKEIIHFEKLFSEQEFTSMQKQIKNNPLRKWSEILGRKYFRNKSNKEYTHYVSYSIPVFNKTKEWAFVYVEYPNSGELWAYRKIEHDWTRIGTGMIWISDPVITPNQLKSEK